MLSPFSSEATEYSSEIEENITEADKLRLQIKQLKKTVTALLDVVIEITEGRDAVGSEAYWILRNENLSELELSPSRRRTGIRMRNRQRRRMRRNYEATKVEKGHDRSRSGSHSGSHRGSHHGSHRRRYHRRVHGAMIGAVVGAMVGAIVGAVVGIKI